MSYASDVTPIFLIGIVLSLLALPVASKRLTLQIVMIFFALLIVHVAASVAYYFYTVSNTADAPLYYYDRTGIGRSPFQFGTIFLIRFTQFFRATIGGSYFDYFLIFQAFGFWGLILLMRSFEEICDNLHVPVMRLGVLLLFLPGIQFWSSALGKDAPLFGAVSLAVWSMLALRRRFLFFVLALGIMVLIRPHVALVAIIALALGACIDERQSTLAKVGLLIIALGGAAIIATSIQNTFQVRVSNADSVSDFFARKSVDFAKIGGGTAVHNASYPFKLFSLLFRPFFIDANGIFALVASVENGILLAMTLFIVRNWREAVLLFRSVYFLKFAVIFAGVLAALLAAVYYNVGLGLRQKIMIMPPLLCFFIALLAHHRRTLQVGAVAHGAAAPPNSVAPAEMRSGGG
jgi:hypothetical protein